MYLTALMILLAAEVSSAPSKNHYLGPRPSKKFHFPWTVSLHYVTRYTKEFFATGSILTNRYVLASMDSFLRRSKYGMKPRFYEHSENVQVVAGSVWALEVWSQAELPSWMEVRKVQEIQMGPNVEPADDNMVFNENYVPDCINSIKRSPYGFRETIALITLKAYEHGGRPGFSYKRSILPIPLHFGHGRADEVEDTLLKEVDVLEVDPFALQCYISGWRVLDGRLLQHQVVYVPFEQCRAIYCVDDQSACGTWPVNRTQICFKSLTFVDLCWRDQGSAVYCEQISNSVVAILTTAPSCGRFGLPGVYTLVEKGLRLLEKYHAHSETYKAISKHDLLTKYAAPKNEEQLLPADYY